MENIILNQSIIKRITKLANLMQVSENEILHKALDSYADKIARQKSLMSFAGSLNKSEADGMLKNIRRSRKNKKSPQSL